MKATTWIVAGFCLAAVACNRDDGAAATSEPSSAAKDAHSDFNDLSPEALDKLVTDKGCVPVDANGTETRAKYGIVPGAVLLTSADFKPTELPADKATKLVFYCGGQACTAAPKAAKIAQQAGYSDVNVMRAGIRGWVDAGKKVDKPTS